MNENALTIDIAPPVKFEYVNVPFMMLLILYLCPCPYKKI